MELILRFYQLHLEVRGILLPFARGKKLDQPQLMSYSIVCLHHTSPQNV